MDGMADCDVDFDNLFEILTEFLAQNTLDFKEKSTAIHTLNQVTTPHPFIPIHVPEHACTQERSCESLSQPVRERVRLCVQALRAHHPCSRAHKHMCVSVQLSMDGLLAIVTSIAHRCKAAGNEYLNRTDSIAADELLGYGLNSTPSHEAKQTRHR